MIIRLKGANFSDNNIGTLSTVSVLTDLGNGATYNGTSSAEKDKSFSATITLAENYEVGSAGVTVTMGGQPLSGAVTISGKTITINIASVTGTIKITVPTKNTATGEEEEPENPDSAGITRITAHSKAKAIPNGSTSTTNLFDAIGYMDYTWNNTQNKYTVPSDTTNSISIPVVPGDKIVWTAVKNKTSNGSSSLATNIDGIRYTLFLGDTKVSSIAPADAYAEYASAGYITIPSGVDCINVPVWDDGYANECFLLTLSENDTSSIRFAPIEGTRTTANSHANVETMPDTVTYTTNLIGTIPQTENYYYLSTGWGAASGLSCITFPVLPGDKISGNVLGTKAENGSTVDGTRVTYLKGDTIVTSTAPATIYNEYKANGYITVPSGCDCMSIPFTSSAVSVNNLNVYLLTI